MHRDDRRPLLDLMENTAPSRRKRKPARRGPGTDHREAIYRGMDPDHLTGQMASVYWFIKQAGVSGMTSKEVASAMRTRINCISGRFSKLVDLDLITPVTVDGVIVKREKSIAYKAK